MGSFENSVMVNETSCVSISGLHSCSELSHPIVDSEMGLASAPDKCTACDFGSSCLSSGDATQTCSVEGDGLEDENKDVDVLGLENLLLDDSGQGAGGLVDKIHSGIGAHETESGRECLQEGSSVSRDGSVGEHKDVDVLGLENFSKNDSLVCGGGLDDSHSDTDVREKESGGECFQDRSSFSREGLVGDCEAVDVLLLENMLRNDSGHSGVFWDKNLNDIDIIREKESGGECLQEDTSGGRDGSGGKLKAVDILRLENLAENDSRHSGGCLGDDHNGIDFHEKESGGKCLQEGISLSRDGSGGEFEAVDNLLVENYSENGSGHRGGCLDENHDDIDVREKESGRQCLQEDISLSRDGSEGEHEVLDNLQLENLLVNDPGHSGGCLDENHIVVDIDEKERGGECLRDGSSVSGDGLVGEYEAALVSLLENLLKNESGVSGACLDENQSNIDACNAESRGDCLQEGKLRGQDDLGNQIRDCEIHSEVITVAELPINCVQLDEQKDEKGVCCLSGEEILEAREDKDDVLAKVSNDLCELEPPSQDHESSESSPDNDNLVNTLEQKEQDLESVGDFSLGNVTGNSTIDCSGQRDDQVNDNEGVNFVSEAKRCGTASSSQKNSRKSRSNRKTPTEKATRKCKKRTKVLCPNGFIKVTFKATKKRSCLSKSARSSAWGLLGNVTQLFEHSNGLEVIQVPDQGPQKPKGGKQSRKQNKKGAHVRSQGSRKKSSPSTTKIRLKVKLGKGVDQGILNLTVPKVVDNTALSTAISRDDRTERCTPSPKVANGEVDDYKNSEVSMQFRCVSSKGDKVTSCPDASVQDSELVNNDLDTNVVTKKLDTDARDDYFGICPNSLVEASGEATESRCKDPGTSPDSEVINLIPDAHIDSRPCDDFHAAVASPKDLADPGDLISNKRGKKKSKPSGLVSSTTEHKSPLPVRINKAKPLKQYGRKQNSNNGICPAENLTFLTSAKASSNSSSDEQPSVVEPLPLSVETALRVSAGALKMETGAEAKIHCKLDDDVGLSKSQTSENFLSPPKPNGRKVPKGKSKGSDLGTKRGNSRNKRETQHSFYGKKKAREQHVSDQIAFKVESQPEAENPMVDDKGKANSSKDIASPDVFNSGVPPAALGEQYLPQRLAWVRCDSCTKWRRIPAEVADTIDEQCSWTCKDNKDKAFADCSIPQEKSNKDINLELEISDASGEEDASNYKGLQCRSRRDLQETPTCISIRTNQYLHRGRKTQTIDEIMVCHCKRHSDGQLGCGDDCLNRMLNIECVQGACPCGDLCSNQQFQKRKYAKLGKFQCGKKGYGLRLLEDISQGKFLIEYVGEVLDMQAYEARQKKYASKGHKHFYFMTLNGSEVIDACIKGNKGRFINHSCDPNCRTEKWMVNGEICIGLFALRDIKKGEEVTFDYNYVRVFGAAAKKCYCGSPQCRGYIGGDPLNGDVIIQSDSDEDHPERKMLRQKIARKPSSSVIKKTSESTLDHIDEKDKRTPPVVQSEISPRKEDSMNSISYVHDVLELDSKEILSSSVQPSEIFQQTEDVTSELVSTAQQESNMEEETTENSPSSSERLDLTPPAKAHIKSLSDSVDSIRKSKSADDQRLSSKAHPKVKTSRASSFVKKEKIRSGPPNTCKVEVAANKSLVLHTKPKKVVEGSFGNNFEAVEEKLNELLDADGGISKRKDASKGYLKLLLLTAASGGSANGEAIQRNRDLSMILDALLKTKSRVVLIDIINKNGLRMLHNIMKQYRRDFKKIPILRKLLKVLEYLAVREILTPEHINGGPPCPGMESFRQSILRLTDHDDRQVHQIARNFRDRWIPKNVRKLGFVDRDDNKTESPRSTNFNRYSARQDSRSDHYGRHAETTDRVKQLTPATTLVDTGIHEGSSGSSVGVSPTNGTKTRKRKSRWDQPAETSSDLIAFQPKEQQIESLQFESTVHRQDKLNGEGSNCPGSVSDCCHFEKANTFLEVKKNILEDVPPGFSSPRKPPPGSSVASSTVSHSQCNLDTVIGHPQQKFISRLPVSYGIPLSIMQQFGTHAENAGSWVIAPGMPFHPFPPLPPYPRDKKQPSPSDDMKRLSVNQPAEEAQPDSHLPATSNSNECTPSTTGDQPDAEMLCTNNHYTMKRGRESSQDLGRRYFKQQKWNNTKLEPPWHLRKNGWGCMGDSRDRASGSLSIENIANEHRSTYCSEDSSCTVEKAGNGTFQHPEHHSQH